MSALQLPGPGDVSPDVAGDVSPDVAGDVSPDVAGDLSPDVAGDVSAGDDVSPLVLPVQAVEPVPFQVEVVRSKRRKRTVGAQLGGGVLRVTVPSWMSPADEAHWVEVMSGRFLRKLSTDRIDLVTRSATLARRYGLRRPDVIRWVDDMRTRWGSCTPATSTVRLSTRLAAFPDWVVDYVIVHELAHLEVADHSVRFWEIAHRYERAERAIGYLIARSNDEDPDDGL